MSQAQAEQGLRERWDADTAMRAQQDKPLHQDEDKHMKIGELIESKYLKQSDVPDPVIVTVHSMKKMNLARDDEEAEYRWTIKFREFEKPLVANVTNLKRLAKALGDESEDWIGKQVELYVDPDIEFGGNIVGGLRVRGLRRTATKPAPRKSDDEINRDLANADDPPFR